MTAQQADEEEWTGGRGEGQWLFMFRCLVKECGKQSRFKQRTFHVVSACFQILVEVCERLR